MAIDPKYVVDYDLVDNVNLFVNRTIRWRADVLAHNRLDHWQTPRETESLGTGDCEDYAILKASKLMASGVPREALKLLYVKTRSGNYHMVLAVNCEVDTGFLWWKKREVVTLLMDNITNNLYTLRESGHTLLKTHSLPAMVK